MGKIQKIKKKQKIDEFIVNKKSSIKSKIVN